MGELKISLIQNNRITSLCLKCKYQIICLISQQFSLRMLQDSQLRQIQDQLNLINSYFDHQIIHELIDAQQMPKNSHQNLQSSYVQDESSKDQKQYSIIESSSSIQSFGKDDQGENFQRYLKEELQNEQKLLEKINEIRKQKQNKNKIRFIQKHRSPKNIFNYHGIDIQVIYDRINNCSGSCLALFYDSFTYENIRQLTLNKSLATYITQKYDEQMIEQMENNQQIIVDFCKKMFKNENYTWVYLIKKPSHKNLPQYSIQKLLQIVSATFTKSSNYKSTKSLVFHDFQWAGLTDQVKCEVFFWALIRSISEEVLKKKMGVSRVTICCDNQSSYFSFARKLREISDSYIQAGLISIENYYPDDWN